VTDRRTVLVPDGLAGERLDAALARMFGFSRTRAADLVRDGMVTLDGEVPAKSDRVAAGALLDVEIPEVVDPVAVVPETVEGISILHDDEAIVVIDKPVGVAVHPSPGWTGPTVVGHLAGAGFAIATSGAAERQGIVQRLDVGTSGVMVIAKSERAYSVLKNAFRERTVDKTYHALVQGHPDPLQGTVDAPIGRHLKHDYKFTVRADGRLGVHRGRHRRERGGPGGEVERGERVGVLGGRRPHRQVRLRRHRAGCPARAGGRRGSPTRTRRTPPTRGARSPAAPRAATGG
jgi:23S rRNA pseudouridine1911/1915/1917 synthase